MAGLRGPTVGRAFVLILADGSGLPKSIKDEMEKAEPFAEQAGHRQSKAYKEGFDSELKKGKGLADSLNEGIGKADAIEKHFSGPEWEATVKRLRNQFGDAGVKLGHDLEEGVRRGGDLDVLHDMLGNIGPEIRRVQGEIADAFDMEEVARKAEQDSAKIVKSVKGVRNEVDKNHRPLQIFATQFDQVGDAIGRAFGKGSRNDALNLIGSMVGFMIKLPGIVAKIADFAIQAWDKVSGFLGKISKGAADAGEQLQEGGKAAAEGLSQTGKAAAEAGEGLAAAGPAGIIAAVSAVAAALLLLPVVIGTVVSAFSLLVGAATALAGSLAFAVAGALAPLAGLLLPIAVGFATVALAMSVWKKESKDASAAVKKATTEVAAADKAVKEATPGTEAYTKAIRRQKIANEELAIAQKGSGDAISASMTKLKSAMDGLKNAAVEGIFGKSAKSAETKQISQTIDNITTGMNTLKPLLTAVGGGVRDFFMELSQPLGEEKGGFADFVKVMTENLPDQIHKLGAIFSNLGGVIGGVFEALQPITNKFLDTQEKLTSRFSEWANSPKGQSQMKDFFDDAWESANKVWEILKNLGTDIGKLFGAGKSTGDSLLDDINTQLEKFGQWLDDNPTALQDWFDQAKVAAENIGDIVAAVLHLIDVLDDPQNRERAQKTFQAIGKAVKATEVTLQVLGAVWDALVFLFNNSTIGTTLRVQFAIIAHAWDILVAAWDFSPIGLVFAAITGGWKGVERMLLDGVHRMLVTIRSLVDAMAKAPGPLGAPFRALKGPIDDAIGKIEDLQSQAAEPMKPVITPVITDYADTVYKLNHLTALANVPREVIIGVQAKIKGGGVPDPRSPGAAGYITNGPSYGLIGEAGPEAVVPLNRPLSQVDPAVRQLSAYAQGKTTPGMASGGIAGAGKIVNVGGLTVITPTKDPFAVAQETVNKLVGAAYI